eukprot:7440212-Karenia_brevis.AAC.1
MQSQHREQLWPRQSKHERSRLPHAEPMQLPAPGQSPELRGQWTRCRSCQPGTCRSTLHAVDLAG